MLYKALPLLSLGHPPQHQPELGAWRFLQSDGRRSVLGLQMDT